LYTELLDHGWDLRRNADFSHGSYEEFFEHLLDLVRVRTEATLHLMESRAWDFFMVHYLETDSVAHTYWRFWEYEGPDHPLHDAMLRLFQTVEGQMQRIFDALPDDATLLVVSDHGVGPVHYHLHLNNWLLQEGFLHWKDNVSTRLRRLTYRLGFNPTNFYRRIPERLLKRLTLGQMRAEFAGIQRQVHTVDGKAVQVKRWLAALMRTPFLYLSDIEWRTSQAYSSGTTQAGLIYINLAGREPDGPVQPGTEYEAVRQAIRARLYTWNNPFTGKKMVDRVCFREELYQGHQLDDAPDLIVFYQDEDYEDRKGAVFLSTNPIEPVKNAVATHRLMGMLLINSPAVEIGPIQSHVTLADMAPLIFYLLGEAVPTEFEGRLPTELLKPALLVARPPQAIDTPTSVTTPAAEGLSASDQEKVLEQLRRLGYLT
jgi:predicted AlkP superfamily phosphohydrolase/phosphomutase